MMRTLVLVTAAVAAADTAWFAIFVLYARDALGLGAFGFGLLLATGAAGGCWARSPPTGSSPASTTGRC